MHFLHCTKLFDSIPGAIMTALKLSFFVVFFHCVTIFKVKLFQLSTDSFLALGKDILRQSTIVNIGPK